MFSFFKSGSYFFVCLLTTSIVFATEPTEDTILQEEIQTYSKQIGYLLAEDLHRQSEYFDLEAVIQGIRQYQQRVVQKGQVDEKINDEAFESLQKKLFEYQSRQNLKQAESYLKEVCKKDSAHILKNDALVYEVLDPGQGMRTFSENDSIAVQYTIFDSCGEMILSDQDLNTPCTCSPDDFLPAISQAMKGMIEGEKRKIYVHPDLAYGKFGGLPPNSLLIIEITLLKIEPSEQGPATIPMESAT